MPSNHLFTATLGILCATSSLLFAEVGYVEPWGTDRALLPAMRSEPWERDYTGLPPRGRYRHLPYRTPGIATAMAKRIIGFHQRVISPVDGPRSHFLPSSSWYMMLAIRHYGFPKGFLMGCDRLLRENREEWVYRTVTLGEETIKWDHPAYPTY